MTATFPVEQKSDTHIVTVRERQLVILNVINRLTKTWKCTEFYGHYQTAVFYGHALFI